MRTSLLLQLNTCLQGCVCLRDPSLNSQTRLAQWPLRPRMFPKHPLLPCWCRLLLRLAPHRFYALCSMCRTLWHRLKARKSSSGTSVVLKEPCKSSLITTSFAYTCSMYSKCSSNITNWQYIRAVYEIHFGSSSSQIQTCRRVPVQRAVFRRTCGTRGHSQDLAGQVLCC